jgi:hypothetical protein
MCSPFYRLGLGLGVKTKDKGGCHNEEIREESNETIEGAMTKGEEKETIEGSLQ